MNILALDTSAKAASCAVLKDRLLLCESFSNAGLTHSVTIMPMVRDMLEHAEISLDDIDVFAVSAGPGSFTGLRIGISAVKGMAMAQNKPCAAVSTLEGLAHNLSVFRGIIVPAMDARRNQVYAAIFRGDGTKPVRVTKDDAISIDELLETLKAHAERGEPVILVGDGAELCFKAMRETIQALQIAPASLLHQRASGVCAVAAGLTGYQTAAELAPVYLRLSQAERERQKTLGKNTTNAD